MRQRRTSAPNETGDTWAPAQPTIIGHLVSDNLWVAAQVVLPSQPKRRQGGGPRRAGDRRVLAAIVYAAVTASPWRRLPPVFGVSWQTVHRRFSEWTELKVWDALHDELLHRNPSAAHSASAELAACQAIIARADE